MPGGRPDKTKHTELERNPEQLRHDQATGSGMRSNLEKEMELLFVEPDVLRQERADRLMEHAELQHRLQCMIPCRKRVAEVASPLAARVSTTWHHRVQTLEQPCAIRPSTIMSAHRRRIKQ